MFKRHILSAVVALGMAVSGQAQQTEQFSIATLNIDGLPQKILVFNVNAEGPGSPGTVRIGKYLLKKDYDLMFLQEDFNYHEELSIVMEDNYRFDTWSGDVGLEGHKVDFLHLQNHRFECDGLMACWKNGHNVSAGQRTAWADGFGKFSHNNDLLATKGFRRYEVTLANGMQLVVYDVHMDAEDDLDTEEGKAGPDRAARQNQRKQLRDEILNRLDDRPVIVLGDFNTFYYRDKAKEDFIDAINASGKATIADVWVELQNKGKFPDYQEDNRVRDDREEEHGGESLDKILYINPASASMSLKPLSYSRDMDGFKHNGKALSDHFPVAATFQLTDRKSTGIQAICNDAQAEGNAEYYNISGQRVSHPASGIYIEQTAKGIRKRIIK